MDRISRIAKKEHEVQSLADGKDDRQLFVHEEVNVKKAHRRGRKRGIKYVGVAIGSGMKFFGHYNRIIEKTMMTFGELKGSAKENNRLICQSLEDYER